MKHRGMRRLTSWRVLLLVLLAPTLLTGCAGSVALGILNAAAGGVYFAAETWASRLAGDFLASLVAEE